MRILHVKWAHDYDIIDPGVGLNGYQPSGLYELSFWFTIEFRTQNLTDYTT